MYPRASLAWASGMVITPAPAFSLIVLVALEKTSPGAAVRANWLPMRTAVAGSSTVNGEADRHGAGSGVLPVWMVEGSGGNSRSKNPGRPRGVRRTLGAGRFHSPRP